MCKQDLALNNQTYYKISFLVYFLRPPADLHSFS